MTVPTPPPLPRSNDDALRIVGLKAYFHTGAGLARAVDGVTFRLKPRETFALVGESGCGKSVTSLSILQLLPRPAGFIAGGQVLFDGRDLTQLPPVEMRKIRGNRISMIFQEPMTALNPVFTIGNQITESLRLHEKLNAHEARERTVEMLEKVGIPDPRKRCDEYPHQMSGGMRQRVMIAMALACRPEILIADEPTTALDVTIQSQILELIEELQSELGTAVLLITHDMGVVRQTAHRVGVMYAGRIVEEAPRERLFEEPSHPYTRLLLKSAPSKVKRGKRLAVIKGMVPRATEFPEGCRFANRCPHVMDRCRAKTPPDFSAGAENHRAACYLLDENVPQERIEAEEQLADAPPSVLDESVVRLDVRDLKMHFPIRQGVLQRTVGHVRAVDGMNLTIRKGETLALVGESGCGKTTVGKCLVRLLDPTDGSILLHGVDVARIRRRGALKPFRRVTQFIFQDPFSSLNPRMMISESIIEGMRTHGIGANHAERLEQVSALLERVGLDPRMASRYPHEFSGGQRQRIGIARALATNPDLIICDEATSSLDVSVQAQILNLLKDIQAEWGLSYLFVTHDLSVVEYLADRVTVMYLGRAVEEGTSDEIFQSPKHPYTKALLSAVPRVEPDGRRKIVLEGDVPSPINPPVGCHFHPRCPEMTPPCKDAYPEIISFSDTHMCRCILYRPKS